MVKKKMVRVPRAAVLTPEGIVSRERELARKIRISKGGKV